MSVESGSLFHSLHFLLQVVQRGMMLLNLSSSCHLSLTVISTMEVSGNGVHSNLIFSPRAFGSIGAPLSLLLRFHVASDFGLDLSVFLGTASNFIMLASSVANFSNRFSQNFSLLELLDIFISDTSGSSEKLHFLIMREIR